MQTRRWTNPGLPQTLQIANFLLYFNGVFHVLDFLRWSYAPFLLMAAGSGAAGYGIANEKKWGYGLGVAMAFLPFALRVYYLGLSEVLSGNPITLLFDIALVALLLHAQSRDYQRIWFR